MKGYSEKSHKSLPNAILRFSPSLPWIFSPVILNCFFISPPLAWTPKVNGVVQPTHTGFLKFIFGDITLVAWNWPWWENLHHENWHILQIRWVFFCVCVLFWSLLESHLLSIYQHTTAQSTHIVLFLVFSMSLFIASPLPGNVLSG